MCVCVCVCVCECVYHPSDTCSPKLSLISDMMLPLHKREDSCSQCHCLAHSKIVSSVNEKYVKVMHTKRGSSPPPHSVYTLNCRRHHRLTLYTQPCCDVTVNVSGCGQRYVAGLAVENCNVAASRTFQIGPQPLPPG